MGRKEERANARQSGKVGGAKWGQMMLNAALAQYGLSPTIGRIAAGEYQRVLDMLEKRGVSSKEDPFISVLAVAEALHGLAPDKLRPLIPFVQGNRTIPKFIPEPFNSVLKGGVSTARAIRMLKNSAGDPILDIHRFSDDAIMKMMVDEGLSELGS